jgi:hypothetical protein
MAVLTAQDRREIPKKDFGVPSKAPGSGSYPLPDKAHAEAALRLDHNAPPSERPKIEAMAHKKLGESPVGDHKAMIAKMHPEHLHRLVQAAHAGQYGPEAKQMAQQAMQPAAMPMQTGSQPTMAPKRNPFSDTSDDDQQQASPAPSGSPFGG